MRVAAGRWDFKLFKLVCSHMVVFVLSNSRSGKAAKELTEQF